MASDVASPVALGAAPPVVLVLRPEPGAATTLAGARARGLDAEAYPLFEIRSLAWEALPRNAIDGLLLGSANALRHAGPALADYRDMPAYVVGQTTADAARKAGLNVAMVGSGGLQGVLDALGASRPTGSTPLRLLRLAGRERLTLVPPACISIDTREVYASQPLPMPPGLTARLRSPALALLHSGEAAARFATLCDEAGIDRAHLALAAIGPRVAAKAGTGWRTVDCATSPDDCALLALAAQMCQDLDPRS